MKSIRQNVWLGVGLILGLALGLGYTWVIQPAAFRGADPNSLQPLYRSEYILMIASSYQATGNLERARDRLAIFPDLDSEELSSMAQQVVAAGGPEDAARGLARLSVALAEQTPSLYVAGVSVSPTFLLTGTPQPSLAITVPYLPTNTRRPTEAATPTPERAFVLLSKEQICNPRIERPLIQVIVQTLGGQGVPGVEIRVQWEGGGSQFVTGMKPELNPGYADYEIEPGKVYQVTLGDGLTVVTGLTAPTCAAATALIGPQTPTPGGGTSGNYAGSWRLVFEMQ
jgi:hypothetical protein